MYRVLMVPIHGSETDNTALSVALRLAKRCGAEMRLVMVETDSMILKAGTSALAEVKASIEAERSSRRRKLEATGAECRAWGVNVTTVVTEGLIAPSLTAYVQDNDVDLVVMPSHDRGGIERATLGSVTDSVIRNTTVPILVVKPPASFLPEPAGEHFGRILVPLDGSALAEQILPQVEALAAPLHSAVTLLQVLTPFTYSRQEITDPALPWWETGVATDQSYLSRAAGYLAQRGLTVQHRIVMGEKISDAILQYASREQVDLIALATSGTGGFRRFVLGSVADEVTRRSRTSVLVFHPSAATEEIHDQITPRSAAY